MDLGAGACEQSHEWRYEKVTEELKANQEIEKLKKRLEETKGLAKKQAKLVQAGSGYGTFAPKTKRTSHLEFVNQSETLKKWKHFFETGILHMPNPEDEPTSSGMERNSWHIWKRKQPEKMHRMPRTGMHIISLVSAI